MPSTVPDSWSVIEAWLQERAPATASSLRPPEATALAQVEDYLAQDLPGDLVDYLRLVPSTRDSLFGLHFPISAAEMVSDSVLQVQIGDEVFADLDPLGSEAGTPEHRFSRAFLRMTSDGGGNALFVDLRPGPDRGCVSEWDKVDGSYSPDPRAWVSVAGLLESVATSLSTGEAFMGYLLPSLANGRLEWAWATDR